MLFTKYLPWTEYLGLQSGEAEADDVLVFRNNTEEDVCEQVYKALSSRDFAERFLSSPAFGLTVGHQGSFGLVSVSLELNLKK